MQHYSFEEKKRIQQELGETLSRDPMYQLANLNLAFSVMRLPPSSIQLLDEWLKVEVMRALTIGYLLGQGITDFDALNFTEEEIQQQKEEQAKTAADQINQFFGLGAD